MNTGEIREKIANTEIGTIYDFDGVKTDSLILIGYDGADKVLSIEIIKPGREECSQCHGSGCSNVYDLLLRIGAGKLKPSEFNNEKIVCPLCKGIKMFPSETKTMGQLIKDYIGG